MSANNLAPDLVTVRRMALRRLPLMLPSRRVRLISSALRVFASIIMMSCFDFRIGGWILIFVPRSLFLTDRSNTSAARISGTVNAFATREEIGLSSNVPHDDGILVNDDKSLNGS